jgi:hypothetical protein
MLRRIFSEGDHFSSSEARNTQALRHEEGLETLVVVFL